MKKIILTSFLGLALVISCQKKQEEQVENLPMEQTTTDIHEVQEKADDHDESVQLELDNGEKWAMNAEMKPFINEMESQINAYKPESDDYKTLGNQLTTINENLMKSCTITGTPHDVLHSWLMPHMEKIEHLKEAKSKEEANEIVEKLKNSMKIYHQYFM